MYTNNYIEFLVIVKSAFVSVFTRRERSEITWRLNREDTQQCILSILV